MVPKTICGAQSGAQLRLGPSHHLYAARDLNHRIVQTIPREPFRRSQKPSVDCTEECWCWIAKMSPAYLWIAASSTGYTSEKTLSRSTPRIILRRQEPRNTNSSRHIGKLNTGLWFRNPVCPPPGARRSHTPPGEAPSSR